MSELPSAPSTSEGANASYSEPKEAAFEASALTHAPSHARLWFITIIGLVIDLWTKDWAFSTIPYEQPIRVLKNVCSLQLSLNPGALFGIGAGLAPVFIGASVIALLFVLYLFASSGRGRWSMHIALGLVLGGALGNLYDRTFESAYVAYMQRGGRVVGDLVEPPKENYVVLRYPNSDRDVRFRQPIDLKRSGVQPVVRDFIKIEIIFPESWPLVGGRGIWPWIFNIADALLVVGVMLLMLNFWRDHRTQQMELAAEDADGIADDFLGDVVDQSDQGHDADGSSGDQVETQND